MMLLTEFNLTPKAKKALKDAKLFAESQDHALIRNEHLIYGCLTNISDRAGLLFESRGIDYTPEKFLKAFNKFCSENEFHFTRSKNQNKWHQELNECLQSAKDFAFIHEDHFIGIEHLLYVLLDFDECVFMEYLYESGLDVEYQKEVIQDLITDNNISSHPPTNKLSDKGQTRYKPKRQTGHQEFEFEHIAKYCKNLNQHVILNDIPPIRSRDSEIEEMVEILSKKNKGNVILTGEAGVGKTAIVEGLVQKIIQDEVPVHMALTQVLSLDITSMIAGTQYRGQFEERIKGLIKELSMQENVILFIDEIHTIVGAGSSTEGSLDASNILKPALARGEIKCIGATTSKEYKDIFEKSAALKRRFDKINIEEPSKEATREMVNYSLDHYESFHNVRFSKKNIDDILNYCHTYLPNKRFPDKAFDIIDQVGAKTKIKNDVPSDSIKDIKNNFNDLMSRPQKQEDIEEYIDRYVKSMVEYVDQKPDICNVHKVDILDVFEQKTGLPQKVISESSKSFSLFRQKIKRDVFGQDEIVEKVYDSLSCVKAGLNDPKKPLTNFLFVGPTSVGKTFTAKKIAKYFYGNERSFLQINMSEYQDKTGISKLIGANAGYVGYNEGGILTDFVRNNPNCVVLFDEIEKADPKILDLLLHLLDEGYISDNLHRDVDFTNTVVILTTNIGHEESTKRSMGFVNDDLSEQESYKLSLKKSLRPELVARLENVLVFNNLNDKTLVSIVDSEIKKIHSKLKDRSVVLTVKKGVKEFILNKIKSEKLNARNIKTLVIKLIQAPLAKFIVENNKIKKISIKVVDKTIKVQ